MTHTTTLLNGTVEATGSIMGNKFCVTTGELKWCLVRIEDRVCASVDVPENNDELTPELESAVLEWARGILLA